MRTKIKTPCPDWCPYMIYTWDRAQLRAWLERNGSGAFYDGHYWTVKSKSLGVGMYEVRFAHKRALKG